MDSKSIADLNGRTLGSGNLRYITHSFAHQNIELRDVVKLPPGKRMVF